MDWKNSFNIGYLIFALALLFLLQDMRDPKHTETIAYSERTTETIDAEVSRLLEEAKARVAATLTAKRAVLEALAKLLLAKKVVDRAAPDALLGESRAWNALF